MDYTNKLYKHDDYIKSFEQEWFKISKVEHIQWLRECQQFFIIDGKRLDDERKNPDLILSFIYKKTPLQKLIEALDCDVKKAKHALNNILLIIDEYTNITRVKFEQENFTITLAQLGLILDLDETFISRTILQDNFEFFSLNYLGRLGIKEVAKNKNNNIDLYYINKNFINKKIFLNRESVFTFLKKYLKLTEDRIKIELNFTLAQRLQLKRIYPEFNDFKKALNIVTTKLEKKYSDSQFYLYKELSKEGQPNREKYLAMLTKDGLNVRKEFLLAKEVDDYVIEDIINRSVNMLSMKSIKNYIKKERNNKKSLDKIHNTEEENKEQLINYISINDTQIYHLLSKCMTYKRFIFENLYKRDEDAISKEDFELKINAIIAEKLIKLTKDINVTLNNELLNKLRDEAINKINEDMINNRKITYVRYITDIDELSSRFLSKMSEEEIRKSKNIETANIVFSLNSVAYKYLTSSCKDKHDEECYFTSYYFDEMCKLAATIKDEQN